jgi:hypothetical protein
MAAKVKVVGHGAAAQMAGGCGAGCGCNKQPEIKEHYITGSLQTPVGEIPQVSTKLTIKDFAGELRVRFGIGRMKYTVASGLYCVGNPDEDSPVLVTANYKLSFDKFRHELNGLNLWILVLDTKGVNVWCAAGKGTFGTNELVHRIENVKLDSIVKHRNIILPQLGATGVAAHEVMKKIGFHVIYGPVRATDIKVFLNSDMNATPRMRTVQFTLFDRLALTPVELIGTIKPLLILFGSFFIFNAVGVGSFGLYEFIAFLGAAVVGTVITPILLPLIPGRAFSLKGALLGLLWAVFVSFFMIRDIGILQAVSFFLLLPSISAYLAMNFTGCSTYTSPTGVKKEMRAAIPVMLIALIIGGLLLMADMIAKLL